MRRGDRGDRGVIRRNDITRQIQHELPKIVRQILGMLIRSIGTHFWGRDQALQNYETNVLPRIIQAYSKLMTHS